MRFRFRSLPVLIIGVSLLAGCAPLRARKKKSPFPAAVAVRVVGRITLVNEEAHFVLIDTGVAPSPAPGETMKSRLSGVETAELKVSEVRKRPFVVADIVKGEPRAGDEVIQ
jgi:hypothetical protein